MGDLNKYVIPKIKTEWRNVANALCYETTVVEAISSKYDNPKESCKELLKDWLTTHNGAKPKIWSTLLEKVGEINELAATIKEIIKDLEATETLQSSVVLSVPETLQSSAVLSVTETPQSKAGLSVSDVKLKILSLSKYS